MEITIFLSRPRRFGKSLLLSTIKEIYLGSKELFKELWIEDKWDWEQPKHPVIHISFGAINYQEKGLRQALIDKLGEIAGEYDITLKETTMKSRFNELIEALGKINRVVILIDEYDNPILGLP